MPTNTQRSPGDDATVPTETSSPASTALAVVVDRRELAHVRAIEPMDPGAMAALVGRGDLSQLSESQMVTYYENTCTSMGLNPMTRPMEFITFKENGKDKVVLYFKAWAMDQIRDNKKVSIDTSRTKRYEEDEIWWVHIFATTADGRQDDALAGIPMMVEKKGAWVDGKNGSKGYFTRTGILERVKGLDLANLKMRCETKAKRRVTLSICGLGWVADNEEIAESSKDSLVARIINEPDDRMTEGANHERALPAQVRSADPLFMDEPPPRKPKLDTTDKNYARRWRDAVNLAPKYHIEPPKVPQGTDEGARVKVLEHLEAHVAYCARVQELAASGYAVKDDAPPDATTAEFVDATVKLDAIDKPIIEEPTSLFPPEDDAERG